MQVAWHGSASVSLQWKDGPQLCIDPMFSRASEYGPWFIPNPGAPSWDEYLRLFHPDLVFVTHGHFDHFDVETIRRFVNETHATFLGSQSVVSAIQRYFHAPAKRLVALEPGHPVDIMGLAILPVEGVHWLCGEEGDRAAAKFASRPDRWGVMPAGGPMLQAFIGQAGNHRPSRWQVYVSGDTMAEGIPHLEADLAIMNVGTGVTNPITKEPEKVIIDLDDAARVISEKIRPQAVMPVHFDHDGVFLQPLNRGDIYRTLRDVSPHPQVIIPPYNTWVDVPGLNGT